MVQAVGAIKGKCLDSTDLSHLHVHRKMQVVVVIKSQMTLIDDAVFFFFSKVRLIRYCFFRPASLLLARCQSRRQLSSASEIAFQSPARLRSSMLIF